MSSPTISFFLTIAAAILDWIAVGRHWPRVKYITKPAVLVLLILWFTLETGWQGSLVWFGLALIFSLAGDVFLMLPRNAFLMGLVAFLLGHLAYIRGYSPTFPPVTASSLGITILVLVIAVLIYRAIRAGVINRPQTRKMRYPVALYSLVITAMVLSALSTLFRANWQPASAILVAVGGLLFYSSDSMLALDRFVRPVRKGRLLVRMTYHIGQIAMIAGVIVHIGHPIIHLHG